MQVIAHHGIGQDIDPEDRGERFHPPANPFASEGEILTGLVIDAREKRPTHAPLHAGKAAPGSGLVFGVVAGQFDECEFVLGPCSFTDR